jgi:hypothetical protein
MLLLRMPNETSRVVGFSRKGEINFSRCPKGNHSVRRYPRASDNWCPGFGTPNALKSSALGQVRGFVSYGSIGSFRCITDKFATEWPQLAEIETPWNLSLLPG